MIKNQLYLFLAISILFSSCKMQVYRLTMIQKVDDSHRQLYASYLADGMELPDTLQTKVEHTLSGFGNIYLEAGLSIMVKYKGAQYWYPLIVPLNNKVGFNGGKPYGYNKIYVDICQNITKTSPIEQSISIDKTHNNDGCDDEPYVKMIFLQNDSISSEVNWTDNYSLGESISINSDSLYIGTKLEYTLHASKSVYGTMQFNTHLDSSLQELFPGGSFPALMEVSKISGLKMITTDLNSGVIFKP